ncbi:nonsense-mediated mRNA decay protein, putative [Medicago truncatula]|uniref:Nonsense-mediated mRNA decay protein, putative n=1 Tax=Medicago truncatula TaxID=3880 RepID=G7ZX57_MEDTR|nr:nonsense-mediated mRNA decay protein, putative [Medicago truncatula]
MIKYVLTHRLTFYYLEQLFLSPIRLEDLICLPPNAAAILGNIGPIVFCSKVSNSIALLDSLALKFGFMDTLYGAKSNDMELDRYIGSIP